MTHRHRGPARHRHTGWIGLSRTARPRLEPAAPRRGAGRSAKPSRLIDENQGFTLLELVVVVIIIGIVAVIALQHLLAVRVDAERAAVTRMVGNLRSGIGMHVARAVLDDNWQAITELDGANPMDLMARVPASYLGELNAPDPDTIAAQRWYFDSRQRLLVYRVEFGEYFESALDAPAQARFKLKLLYADKNGNGRFDRFVDEFEGADVVKAEPFRWLSQSKSAE